MRWFLQIYNELVDGDILTYGRQSLLSPSQTSQELYAASQGTLAGNWMRSRGSGTCTCTLIWDVGVVAQPAFYGFFG